MKYYEYEIDGEKFSTNFKLTTPEQLKGFEKMIKSIRSSEVDYSMETYLDAYFKEMNGPEL